MTQTETPTTETPPSPAPEPAPSPTTAGAAPRRRPRRMSRFSQVPPPIPIRGVWLAATTEEHQQAHRIATLLLESWLGRRSRAEIGRELNLPPIRITQLSRMALAGMTTALLRQPTSSPKGRPPLPPEENPRLLKKRMAELEQENQLLQGLVTLLRDLPSNRALATPPAGEPAAPREKKSPARPPRRPDARRHVAADPGAPPTRPASAAGPGPRRD